MAAFEGIARFIPSFPTEHQQETAISFRRWPAFAHATAWHRLAKLSGGKATKLEVQRLNEARARELHTFYRGFQQEIHIFCFFGWGGPSPNLVWFFDPVAARLPAQAPCSVAYFPLFHGPSVSGKAALNGRDKRKPYGNRMAGLLRARGFLTPKALVDIGVANFDAARRGWGGNRGPVPWLRLLGFLLACPLVCLVPCLVGRLVGLLFGWWFLQAT